MLVCRLLLFSTSSEAVHSARAQRPVSSTASNNISLYPRRVPLGSEALPK